MPTFRETVDIREIVRLEQEMVSLKAAQRYSARQVKGYKSNVLRIDSYILHQTGSYTVKGIEGTLRFRNDTLDKIALPRLIIEFYDTSGTQIYPMSTSGLGNSTYMPQPTENPNEFTCRISCDTQQPAFDFYVLCWVSSNDTGILEVLETHTW